MAVPKRKVSRQRRDTRSANKGIDPQPVMFCQEGLCKGMTPKLAHQVCPKCGFYKGKKVLRTKKDRDLIRTESRSRMEARVKQQEAMQQEQEQSGQKE